MAKLEISTKYAYPSELAFQVDVENRLRNAGYRVFSIRDSRRVTMPGWPDIVAWRDERIFTLELKMPKNKLSAAQVVVLSELSAAGIDCYVIYPKDVEFLKSIIEGREPHGYQTEDTNYSVDNGHDPFMVSDDGI